MKRFAFIATIFFSGLLTSTFVFSAPANAATTSNCSLVNGVPNVKGASKPPQVIAQAGAAGLADFKNEIITFPNGDACEWSGSTTLGVTTWKLANPVGVTLAAPKSTNVKNLIDGLEFYALMACLVVIVISSLLWVTGYKTQNPGQELSAKRGLITSLVAAMLIGAIPALMDFTTTHAKNFDSAGVITAGYDANVSTDTNATGSGSTANNCSKLGAQGSAAC